MRWLALCLWVWGAVASLGLGGCATVLHSGPEAVTITSEPPDAQVTISNIWTRRTILQATTPVVASLARHAGYMQPARYQIVVDKAGYQPYVLRLEAHVDERYFGNFVSGGPLGFLVIDPLTGAMYALPRRVHAVLGRANGVGGATDLPLPRESLPPREEVPPREYLPPGQYLPPIEERTR
jgi:hypothetical protein